MKKLRARSGEAQAALGRPPTTHHHRLEPRGGARRSAYEEEVELKHVAFTFALSADAAELLFDLLHEQEARVLEDGRVYQCNDDDQKWFEKHAACIARIRETIAAGSKAVP